MKASSLAKLCIWRGINAHVSIREGRPMIGYDSRAAAKAATCKAASQDESLRFLLACFSGEDGRVRGCPPPWLRTAAGALLVQLALPNC